MDHFRQEKKIHTRFAFEIVMGARKVLQQLPTLVDVDIPPGMPSPHVTAYILRTVFVLLATLSYDAEGPAAIS